MSKLLARAKVKHINAEDNYLKMGQDDTYLDEVCFGLHQSIELCLKYLVEMNGENYVESHDILSQINKLKELNAYIPMEEELITISSLLTIWETEPRYNDNFTASLGDIDTARQISSKLVSYCDSLVEEY